jgi:hypothetical protein
MKVLNLHCANGHDFEGWFACDDDFTTQMARSLVQCPLCGEARIERRPTAPRLNLGAARSDASGAAVEVARPAAGDLQAQWMRAVRHVLAHTEDVGERFATEARRIHYGEVPERGIRGKATPQESEALRDEGIEVMSLPLPRALEEPLQ